MAVGKRIKNRRNEKLIDSVWHSILDCCDTTATTIQIHTMRCDCCRNIATAISMNERIGVCADASFNFFLTKKEANKMTAIVPCLIHFSCCCYVQVSNVFRLTNFECNCLVIWNGTMSPCTSDTLSLSLQDRSRSAVVKVYMPLHCSIRIRLLKSKKEPQIIIIIIIRVFILLAVGYNRQKCVVGFSSFALYSQKVKLCRRHHGLGYECLCKGAR